MVGIFSLYTAQPYNVHATLAQILSTLAQFARQFLTPFFCKFCAIFPFLCNIIGGGKY